MKLLIVLLTVLLISCRGSSDNPPVKVTLSCEPDKKCEINIEPILDE